MWDVRPGASPSPTFLPDYVDGLDMTDSRGYQTAMTRLYSNNVLILLQIYRLYIYLRIALYNNLLPPHPELRRVADVVFVISLCRFFRFGVPKGLTE